MGAIATSGASQLQQLREVVAATVAAVAGGQQGTPSVAMHKEMLAMQSKKKQKLLEKVGGGRATHKVMGSAPVGVHPSATRAPTAF